MTKKENLKQDAISLNVLFDPFLSKVGLLHHRYEDNQDIVIIVTMGSFNIKK